MHIALKTHIELTQDLKKCRSFLVPLPLHKTQNMHSLFTLSLDALPHVRETWDIIIMLQAYGLLIMHELFHHDDDYWQRHYRTHPPRTRSNIIFYMV